MTLTKASFFGEPTEEAEETRQGAGNSMPEQMTAEWHDRMNAGRPGRGSKRVGGGGMAGGQSVPGLNTPSAPAGRGYRP